MKKIFMLILLLWLGCFATAQIDVANSGFEEWIGDTVPASWTTVMNGDLHITFSGIPLNIFVSANFGTRSTDAHEGMYAVKLQAKTIKFMGYEQPVSGLLLLGASREFDVAYDLSDMENMDMSIESLYALLASGDSCSYTPDSLILWAKYLPVDDTMSVLAFTRQNGVIVSQATYMSNIAMNEYTRLSIPFDFPHTQCDTICIAIMSNAMAPNLSSELYVDDVSLKYLTGDNNVTDNILSSFQIYPNPADDYIFLNPASQDAYDYQLLNLTGKVVRAGTQVRGSQSLSVSALASGIYMLRIRQEQQTITRKVVVQ